MARKTRTREQRRRLAREHEQRQQEAKTLGEQLRRDKERS